MTANAAETVGNEEEPLLLASGEEDAHEDWESPRKSGVNLIAPSAQSELAASDAIDEFAIAHGLSPQEARLLHAALRELTDKKAATELGCSPSTVRTYWARIFQKVGCTRQRDVLARVVRFVVGLTCGEHGE
jgi:DNA-binding CsgD family transcriptional regulator